MYMASPRFEHVMLVLVTAFELVLPTKQIYYLKETARRGS